MHRIALRICLPFPWLQCCASLPGNAPKPFQGSGGLAADAIFEPQLLLAFLLQSFLCHTHSFWTALELAQLMCPFS